MSSGRTSSSTTLEGIDPPASILSKVDLMLWPDGRTVVLTPRWFSRIISLLYDFKTFLLSAFGHDVVESHQTYSTESLIRTRRTLTHSAGVGILAGLYQKHSCARRKPTFSTRAIKSLKWYKERVGSPGL